MVTKAATNKIFNMVGEKVILTTISILGSIATAAILWIGSTIYSISMDVKMMAEKISAMEDFRIETKAEMKIHTVKIDSLTYRVYRLESR